MKEEEECKQKKKKTHLALNLQNLEFKRERTTETRRKGRKIPDVCLWKEWHCDVMNNRPVNELMEATRLWTQCVHLDLFNYRPFSSSISAAFTGKIRTEEFGKADMVRRKTKTIYQVLWLVSASSTMCMKYLLQ